jgi:hypothetical protein
MSHGGRVRTIATGLSNRFRLATNSGPCRMEFDLENRAEASHSGLVPTIATDFFKRLRLVEVAVPV